MKRRAFTMLELVVTTAILAILTTSAFPYLRQYQLQLDLEEAALSLQNCFASSQDYARAPSAGATAYRATVYPLERKCVVSRQAATTEIIDEYIFEGLDLSTSLALREFGLVVGTDVLHTVSYSAVGTNGAPQSYPSSTAVWEIRPTGRTTPVKQVSVNLLHGIVTVQP